MSTFTYKTLTALALTGALLAAPAFAEEAHHSPAFSLKSVHFFSAP